VFGPYHGDAGRRQVLFLAHISCLCKREKREKEEEEEEEEEEKERKKKDVAYN
jgi:hypothetical protein